MNITILGGGSWGASLAVHLAKKEHSVKIWEFFEQQAREMQEKRVCPMLPQVTLPNKITVTSDMKSALTNSELILIVVPSDKVESTLAKASVFIDAQPVIICSKGFANEAKLLSEIVQSKVKGEVYCLYGPTHAEEVCLGMFSGIVLAGKGKEREKLKRALEDENFKVDVSDDIVGVQVCAALKNVLAVFVGVLDGLGGGDNAKAYIMTRGLAEITQIGLAWGAKRETFTGLAGIGDIIVTCTSKHSRNRYVGEQLGKGRKLDDILTEMKMIAEGITAVKHAYILEQKFKLELPLITGMHQILEGADPKTILRTL